MAKSAFLKSRRFWLSFPVLAGLVFLGRSPLVITAAIMVLFAVSFPATLRPLRFVRFWIAILLLVVIVPIFTGVQDRTILGVSYSQARLIQTTLMALRGILIFLLIQVWTVNLDSQKFAAILSKYGGENFTTLYDLSREILPNARYILKSRIKTHRRSWREFLHPGQLLDAITSVFVDLIRLARRLEHPPSPSLDADHREVIDAVEIQKKPVLVIITGEPGSGKTQWLQKLYDLLKQRDQNVDGVITLREYVTKEVWQLKMTVLSSGESKTAGKMEPIEMGVETENYYMDPSVMAWGAHRLAQLSPDWLIVDEVGIFEFNKQGYFPALQEMDSTFSGHLIVGLRKSLLVDLDQFLEKHFPEMNQRKRYFIQLDGKS